MDIREQFPILNSQVYGKPLIYLDNAATTQKPQCVVDTLVRYYTTLNSNIHRGAHYLAAKATEEYEGVRKQVQQFINARHSNQIIFTRRTTESINLVASSFGRRYLQAGDEVIVSGMEHHSNIVPWQLACEQVGAHLRIIPFSDEGVLDLDAYRNLFNEKTRIVAVNHVSNTLGTINPVAELTAIAHSHNVPILIDGAQSVSHIAVDVQALDCDFYCFSGHKMYGPMGVGVLYGKEAWLEKLPPYQGGGEMIENVSFEKTTFERPPLKFEAGTPDYIATTGLAKALDYVTALGIDNIARSEEELTAYAVEKMLAIDGMKIFGIDDSKPITKDALRHHDAVISFQLRDIHHMDMGTLLDHQGIAIRTGHHCAQPLMQRLNILGTSRASFALYNTKQEIDALVAGIERVSKMF